MSELRNANVKHCLDMLRDFHETAVLDGNAQFMEKKEQARQALDQLSNMFIKNTAVGDEQGDTCTKNAKVC